ncbi:MAG: hypothetical protein AB7Q97_15460 [Gammaproteobacteria bacterium]
MKDARTFAFEKILKDIRRLAAQAPPQYRIARALLDAGYGEAEIGQVLCRYPDIPEKLRLAIADAARDLRYNTPVRSPYTGQVIVVDRNHAPAA